MKRAALALLLAVSALGLDYSAWLGIQWMRTHEWAVNARVDGLGRCYAWNFVRSGFRSGCYR